MKSVAKSKYEDVNAMRGATLYAKLIARLAEEPSTYRDLEDYTGLSYHTVIRYCKALKAAKMVFIEQWESDDAGNHSRAAFRLTTVPKRDATRPRLTQHQKYLRYRDKKNRSRHLFPADTACSVSSC